MILTEVAWGEGRSERVCKVERPSSSSSFCGSSTVMSNQTFGVDKDLTG